jgi:N-acetylglucosamine malate deacetylase 2
MTRKQFLLSLGPAAPMLAAQPACGGEKVLHVVAHPDDEYTFAATVYRIAKELHGPVDHVVITNGEAGYKYSQPAEQFYKASLTREDAGRSRLSSASVATISWIGRTPGIRSTRRRLFASGTRARSRPFLTKLLERERYSFVFTLLPTPETHGHREEPRDRMLKEGPRQSLPHGRGSVGRCKYVGTIPSVSKRLFGFFSILLGRSLLSNLTNAHE